MPTIEETTTGTYTEPFTLTQYGAFTTKSDGNTRFVAASLASPEDAVVKAEDYYYHMNQFEHNNMDMSDLDRIYIRTRPVTYGLWED